MVSKCLKKIRRAFLYFLYLIYRTQKIEKNLVAFYSFVDYSDNSRVLYDYLLTNYSKYDYIWLLYDHVIPDEKPKTKFVKLFGSIDSAKFLAKSKYIFYTHPLGHLFYPRKDQVVVNLWHGIPFKGIKGEKAPLKPQFNYLLCLGDNNLETTAAFVGCDVSYVRPWGFPRNDLLFSSRDDGKNNPFAPQGFKGKLIIWMPTFRKSLLAKHLSEEYCDNGTGLPLLETIEHVIAFNNFLCQINIVMLIKIHPFQAPKDVFNHIFTNIIFIKDEDIISKGYQLYEIVAKTDALITDYSSIYADYLLMNRPIGFILDDIKEYIKSRGEFMYNPITTVLAGCHIYNIKEFYAFLEEIAHGIDSTAEIRKQILPSMIKYPDGNTCERIVKNLGM